MGIARLPTKIHIQVGIWCMKVVLLEWLCWLCLLHEHVNTSVFYELSQKYSVCILCIYIYAIREREIQCREVSSDWLQPLHSPTTFEEPLISMCTGVQHPKSMTMWQVFCLEGNIPRILQWKTMPFPYCCYDELIMRYLLFPNNNNIYIYMFTSVIFYWLWIFKVDITRLYHFPWKPVDFGFQTHVPGTGPSLQFVNCFFLKALRGGRDRVL